MPEKLSNEYMVARTIGNMHETFLRIVNEAVEGLSDMQTESNITPELHQLCEDAKGSFTGLIDAIQASRKAYIERTGVDSTEPLPKQYQEAIDLLEFMALLGGISL